MTTVKFYVKHSHVFPAVYALKQVLVQMLFLAVSVGDSRQSDLGFYNLPDLGVNHIWARHVS